MYFNRKEQFITIEGKRYSSQDVQKLLASTTSETPLALVDLFMFLEQWFDDSTELTVQTSGSTGTPKELTVRKEQMMQSARMTCEALQLYEGDTALLCMSLQYIAGKMMVVRALVGGLNLIVRPPSGHPLADVTEKIQFAAMVPLQVYNTLDTPDELKRLRCIDKLLIGGGMINPHYWHELRTLPKQVYVTYGMTETLSHIALCQLTGDDVDGLTYYPLPGVKLSTLPDNTLVIDAPLLSDEIQYTNDVVSFDEHGGFLVLGRRDNTINSGGIKMQPEILEGWLQSTIPMPFVFTSAPHERLGEAVVLLIEGVVDIASIRKLVDSSVPRHYRCSKYIIPVKKIPITGNGKIDRAACKQLAYSFLGKSSDEN